MKVRRKIEESQEELALGIALSDNFLFNMLFMKKELSMEPTIPQKCMLCDYTRKTLLCTSRNVGKTVSIRGRLLRDIATFLPTHMNDGITRNEEILLVTPAQAHLSPLIDKLYADIDQVPFFKSIVQAKRGGDMPEIITKTGLTIFGRIEGLGGDDRNMQGLHPIKIYGDELQFGNMRNHRSRMGGAMPETEWLYAGVPNGVSNTPFYNLDQTKEGRTWSRHKFSMLTANPRFIRSKKHRTEMAEAFGGVSSNEYLSQVLGKWGESASSSFPTGSVSWNAELPYYICNATAAAVSEAISNNTLPSLLKIPQVQCYRAACGWDYGLSPDPGTFIVAVQYAEGEAWKTYCRVSLYGVMMPRQIDILRYLWQYVLNNKAQMVSVDSPESYQTLLSDENKFIFGSRVKETLQGGTVEVDMVTGRIVAEKDDKPDAEFLDHRKEGKTRKVRRKQFLTELFRSYMSNNIMGSATATRLELGHDTELESELMVTIERKTPSGYLVFDTGKKGKVNMDQVLDACRAMTDSILTIENSGMSDEFGIEELISAMGWSVQRGEQKWDGTWLE